MVPTIDTRESFTFLKIRKSALAIDFASPQSGKKEGKGGEWSELLKVPILLFPLSLLWLAGLCGSDRGVKV